MKTKIIAASIALLGFSGSAFAQGYLGVGVVGGKMDLPGVSTTISGVAVTGSADKTSDTGFKLFGGYNFTPNWGIELAYNDLGNSYSAKGVVSTVPPVPFTVTGLKGSNWTLAGVGTLPLSNEFSIFAKAGVAWNHSSGGAVNAAGFSMGNGSDNRTSAMFGVGANFNFTKNWAARLEWEDYGKATKDDVWGTGGTGAAKASAWTLSLKYAF
jgi:OOP family OmpA-OmpF porin